MKHLSRYISTIILVCLINHCSSLYDALDGNINNEWEAMCPNLYPKVFKSYTPKGNLTFGMNYKKVNVINLKQCVESCCSDDNCHVALMYNSTCYQVECTISKMCTPLYRHEFINLTNSPNMVLVRPIENNIDTNDILEQIIKANEQNSNQYDNQDNNDSDVVKVKCMDKSDCPRVNDVCIKTNDPVGFCSQVDLSNFNPKKTNLDVKPKENGDDKSELKKLIVSTVSKEVRLPDNEVTLSAFTVPSEQDNEHYHYIWSLLSKPEGNTGTMSDQNKSTVKLSNLSEGLYKFRVIVTGRNAYGDGYANVKVLPRKRINKPPTAIIIPKSQVVKLPNTGAILDGSSSSDDDKIISYHWELQRGPIGYKNNNYLNTPTLQLNNLIPGNYTFKLTIEDSDNVFNYTTANITVLKLIDYPPSANAGEDIILYLPKNNIILNGNLSTDDHGIVSWEWTKSQSDENKAVDMQNTRTPYLKLSNLEEGMYTFVLKVSDDSDQTSEAEVHVFVKPPTNKPPKADPGNNMTLSLPIKTILLNGNNSKDDGEIVRYYWEQLSGPSKVIFSSQNKTITNVTNLTKGIYLIKLTVYDNNGNKDSNVMKITITQNKNEAPVANAGGDKTFYEPINILMINGNKSRDDLNIIKWQWFRDPSSIALGNIVNGSDRTSLLMITDIVPGRYKFKLSVSDEQGLSSEDTITVIVKQDPLLYNLIEIILNISAEFLTETLKKSLILKLEMLLNHDNKIYIRDIKSESRTGRAVIIFYVKNNINNYLYPATDIVDKLKMKLKQDSGIVDFSVASIDTFICQNNCSGHGSCDEKTRQCMCQTFWVQNYYNIYIGNGVSTCSWNILYVIIASIGIIILFISLICLICKCFNSKKDKKSKNNEKYLLLGAGSHKRNGDDNSESESESDVILYEQKGVKNIDDHFIKNGLKSHNGFHKNNSRIKT